ncbi:MAG: hypothetical protein DCF22_20060 [Leptolyngbya sp.]|nr:MAG: hypothetical protein DCF22_20060 [Leptolyngbya sp.]
MTTRSRIKNRNVLNFAIFSSSFNQFLGLLRRTFLMGLLISLIWLPGLSINPALAISNVDVAATEKAASQMVDAAAKGDRLSALINCLPKQLSQPSLKQALSEMGNDQIERALNLKATPKLSQAEVDLASCLDRKSA